MLDRHFGCKRVIARSDTEPAIMALLREVIIAMLDVEIADDDETTLGGDNPSRGPDRVSHKPDRNNTCNFHR